jgi:hypothetical protein
MIRWVGHVACIREKRNIYGIVFGKHADKRPLGRPRCRWEDNMKWDLQWDWNAWTGLIWLRTGTNVGPL